MFDNTPNETQYFYTDLDSSGQQLGGTENYSVTFAAGQEPPINGFWSLTLDAGAKAPDKGKESNWLPAPNGPFSLYIRAYWGKQPILDGSGQLPKIQLIE